MFITIAGIIILLVSILLALKAYKNYETVPFVELPLNFFLVKNSKNLTEQIISSLHKMALRYNCRFCIELLIKGEEKALVLAIPNEFTPDLKELELLEIEDYLNQNTKTTPILNCSAGFSIDPKKISFPQMGLLENFRLSGDNFLSWQLVCFPLLDLDVTKLKLNLNLFFTSKDDQNLTDLKSQISSQLSNFTSSPDDSVLSKKLGFEDIEKRLFKDNDGVYGSGDIIKLIGSF